MSTELAIGGKPNMAASAQLNSAVPPAADKSSTGKSGFSGPNILRQISMVLALAICLALTVFIMMWAQTPDFRPVGKMETQQMVQVLDILDKNKIDYQIDIDQLSVPEDKYQQVKMLLARAGLDGGELTNDFLSKDSGFGVSQRMEQARLKYSQEQNLARVIEELKSVNRAKVILALPKESVFARHQSKPSATVVVNTTRAGLNQEEIDSIVDIVASAVHKLEPTRVTVTDSNGRLLNSGSQDGSSVQARRDAELVQQKETEYRNKIDSILIPILGPENFSSQVNVAMDFTAVEQTVKRYNPDLPALRSEMVIENSNVAGANGGIPGALTNQPPMPAEIPEEAGQAGAAQTEKSGSSHKEATRNFELDTTISHTRQQVGMIQRISVSVAVDYKPGEAGADGGAVAKVTRTEQELNNIRRLLEGAVGFNAARGDVIEVVSVPFLDETFEATPEPAMWDQPWFWRAMKLLIAAIVILVLILAVVRPVLKKLTSSEPDSNSDLASLEEQYAQNGMLLNGPATEYSYAEDGSIIIPDLHKDDDMVKSIRSLVANEPELSTQVVQNWLVSDDKK